MSGVGYSDEFRRNHELETREREKQLEDARRANAAIRQKYLAKLEAEKQERAARDAAELEAELAPMKAQELRLWLIDHPDKNAADFEKVWPAVKEQRYTGRDVLIQREIAAQKASGRYSY
jgi:hypothetical protein